MITSKAVELFYLFFEGIMLFQVVFFGMVYLISRRRDVLYYSLLNLVTAIYFFLNAPDTFLGIDENIVFNSPIYLYVNFALLLTLLFTYLIFLKEFFNDTLEKYWYAKLIYRITSYTIPFLYVLFLLFAFFGWDTNIIFYTAHQINGPFCLVILFLNYKAKGYKSLMVYAMLVTFFCLFLTLVLTIRYNAGDKFTILDRYPLLIVRIGMLIDILLFQLTLLKRWTEQEKQLAVEKLQSQLDAEKLRNKISADLHDDIGSTISGISMYSYMTHSQLQNADYDKAKSSIAIIQKSAGEIVGKLSDLVWAINPNQDSFTKMLEKIEAYGEEMCRTKNIRFQSSCQNLDLIKEPGMDVRQHLYLLLKEAINNAVKYSAATLIQLETSFVKDVLKINVDDNGKGFDTGIASKGNGLVNMQQRATAIGAACLIRSAPGSGTSLSFQLKIPQ